MKTIETAKRISSLKKIGYDIDLIFTKTRAKKLNIKLDLENLVANIMNNYNMRFYYVYKAIEEDLNYIQYKKDLKTLKENFNGKTPDQIYHMKNNFLKINLL